MYRKEKNVCIACNAQLPAEELLFLENMPASAQDIPDKEEVKNDRGISLRLYQCAQCGLVQFDSAPVDYYKDVIRSGGFSTTMVELRRRQYTYLINKYSLRGKNFLEIGCGQGEFLKTLCEFDVNGYGIENRMELVDKAKENGLKVWKAFAENKDTKLVNPYGENKFDVFLSFNFLEHQPHPKEMLEFIYENLEASGMGLITVPSLEYILEHDGYYELIRDHLAYYTFETLENLLSETGFEVLEREMVNRDTLSVIVRKRERTSEIPNDYVINKVEITGVCNSINVINEEVKNLLLELKEKNKKIAIWGASHQGFTLAATTLLKEQAKYIIDSAPFKQGRFAPASHLPIVSPNYFEKEPVEVILIVAPGYTDEIAKIIREKFGEDIEILVLKSKHIERYGRKDQK